ncbi:MAG: Do family serine endopeptidase [Devosia sp.]
MIGKNNVLFGLGGALFGVALGYFVLSPVSGQSEGVSVPVEPVAIAPEALPTTAVEPPRAVPETREQMQLSFAPVVRSVTPAVVNVYATTRTQQAPSPFAADPFFQRFFGGSNPLFAPRERESQSLGSGVIIDPSGVILTNAHVVEGATDIRIATADGREFPVDMVLDDTRSDLAVLRVRDAGAETFPALSFSDSDALEVGDLVLAIGNPFGVGQTVTSGIVSALARTGVESSNYEFFIQTDAAINPGNSGGALVDLSGRLVGINTAIFTRSGGSIGIGFAVPANMAKVVAEAGIAGGQLVRPWLGARTQEVSADIASSLGLERARGALVTELAADGPAARAGLAVGDVVLCLDGQPVDQPSALDFRLATRPVGGSAEIVFFRDGQQYRASLPLAAAPSAGDAAIAEISGNTRFAGTSVETLSPAVAQELGLPFEAQGVVVRAVDPRSPAARLGLRPGDIILSLNDTEIVDAEGFARLVDQRPEAWRIVLQRGGRVLRSIVSG